MKTVDKIIRLRGNFYIKNGKPPKAVHISKNALKKLNTELYEKFEMPLKIKPSKISKFMGMKIIICVGKMHVI